MKQFTVVFPVAKKDDKIYLLLGRQQPGKPLAEYYNGYGGKVEETDESIEAAAERELQEELEIGLQNPVSIGSIVHGEKEVFFYLALAEYKPYADTEETRDNTWHDISDEHIASKMLPGDIAILSHIRRYIGEYFEGSRVPEFTIVKEGDEIAKAVARLDQSLLPKILR
jgi:8-oxo-dGTP pyrophosphatase MutT (NUDIX family)